MCGKFKFVDLAKHFLVNWIFRFSKKRYLYNENLMVLIGIFFTFRSYGKFKFWHRNRDFGFRFWKRSNSGGSQDFSIDKWSERFGQIKYAQKWIQKTHQRNFKFGSRFPRILETFTLCYVWSASQSLPGLSEFYTFFFYFLNLILSGPY